MSTTTTVIVSAGATQKVSLPNWAAIETMIVSNSTQFDIIWAGFGVQGQIDIPAGHQWKFEAKDYNAGSIIITAQDNLNVGGSGPVSINSFQIGEPIPAGMWPVTVPAQRVITPVSGSVVADHLINTSNAASASPIMQIQEAGATGAQMQADNQGNFFVQDYVSSVLTTVFRTIAGGAAGSVDVIIGDTNRQAQVNGQMQCNSRLWANSEISINDSLVGSGGGSSIVAYIQIFNNSHRGIEITPNSGVTGFIGVQVDSSGVNNTGTGFLANAVLLGAYLTSCFNGLKIDGLVGGIGIDMTGMTAPSGPSIATGPNPIALQAGSGAFSTGNGSVGGTANLFTPVWGAALKIGLIILTNFNTAANVTLLFPSAFLSSLQFYSGDIATTTFSFYNGATQQTLRHMLTLGAAGAAGTSEGVLLAKGQNIGTCLTQADRVIIQTTGGAGINNVIAFIGV